MDCVLLAVVVAETPIAKTPLQPESIPSECILLPISAIPKILCFMPDCCVHIRHRTNKSLHTQFSWRTIQAIWMIKAVSFPSQIQQNYNMLSSENEPQNTDLKEKSQISSKDSEWLEKNQRNSSMKSKKKINAWVMSKKTQIWWK